MNERRKTITPQKIDNPAQEDPNATKRPGAPPSPSEPFKVEQAMQAKLRDRLESEMTKLGERAEALEAEREVRGEWHLAEEDMREAREGYVTMRLSGLDIKSEHAAAAGIENIDDYRAWLKRRFEGRPPTEYPATPGEEEK